MKHIFHLTEQPSRLAIGLMSGTCTDGMDAALVRIEGCGIHTKVELLEFLTIPYDQDLRSHLLQIASGSYGGSYEISKANVLIGELSAKACLAVCEKADIAPEDIDFIGSHGHTIYHQPVPEDYFGHRVHSTLQIGEAAVISEVMKCPVIADFRVRDVAAGGLGAPLVPYTEYVLYTKEGENIALQNIGGIGNITFLPANGDMNSILAFDTGPGNMIIDALVAAYTNNEQTFDDKGAIAASGTVHDGLLNWLLSDPYIHELPPKTTGREHYGKVFVEELITKGSEYGITFPDMIATSTLFTAKSIEISVNHYLPEYPAQLIVGGGGSHNKTLLAHLRTLLTDCQVLTNEDLGLDSNAKEAIAFAILANETLFGISNNVPTATGAHHPVVMGKITL